MITKICPITILAYFTGTPMAPIHASKSHRPFSATIVWNEMCVRQLWAMSVTMFETVVSATTRTQSST